MDSQTGQSGSGVVGGVEAGGPSRHVAGMRLDFRLWVGEAAASWLVRRTLEVGYRRATGRDVPSSRDRTVPLHRILVWTAVTAASVAVADAVVDRVALRSQPSTRPDAPVSAPPG